MDYTFSIALLNYLSNEKNSVISPVSLKTALAMVCNGAAGETRKQIQIALKLDDLNNFNKEVKSSIENKYLSVVWSTANSIWVNKMYISLSVDKFKQEFRDNIKINYNGITGSIESKNDISIINDWVCRNTNGLIKNAVKNADFELMIVNTAYFRGIWMNPFPKHKTKQGIFYNKDGSESVIDFMCQNELYPNEDLMAYYEDEEIRALTMCYSVEGFKTSDPFDMTFIISDSAINNEILNRIYKLQKKEDILFKLPKFKIEIELDMSNILKKMGVINLFEPHVADLALMTEEAGCYVDKIIQNISISVDENGTEAAVVSQINMMRGISQNPTEFILNRPFYYFIRNKTNGDILFVGYYATAK